VILYNKCLICPHDVLKYIFHFNDDFFCQLFVMYLNLTIKSSSLPNELHPDTIIEDFCGCQDKQYGKLMLYYLNSKHIMPYLVQYDKYSSQIDI
jgi:hypothetical protein